ncbi:MAG: amidophosphoribosyltransferase [Firmicutes bacterium]|nr:amidophosphoribosyltransferase [Bacillota bacterium]
MEESCGLFGVYLNKTEDGGLSSQPAQMTYYGLYSLQHRGQESAGIAVSDRKRIAVHKDMGLVPEVFNKRILEGLLGSMAVGHVRYSTTGSSLVVNAQPLVFHYLKGMIALAHNGNLTNAKELHDLLAGQGSVFQSTTDSEIIVNLLARYSQSRIEEALMKCMIDIKGAYALLIMTEDKLIGVRDPYGIRPLCLGRLGDKGHILASETCALDTIGAEFVRDLDPGEIVVIDQRGVRSMHTIPGERKALCIFEYVYFARPDSIMDGVNVHQARKAMGRQLARENDVQADLVISVPDSGTPAALGYAEESGIPFEEGLMKNRYIGRTFIQPSQEMRDLGVRLKLNPVQRYLKGRRVIMVDDSIVRGTTSRQIVRMLREAGAIEVHMAISSPPTRFPCFYGIDTTKDDLIAVKLGREAIREFIGADSLHYLSLEGLKACFPGAGDEFCTACFSGKYPVEIPGESEGKYSLEKESELRINPKKEMEEIRD